MPESDGSAPETIAAPAFGQILAKDAADLVQFVEQTGVIELAVEFATTRFHFRRAVSSSPQISQALESTLTTGNPLSEPELYTVSAPVVGKFYLVGDADSALRPGHQIEVGEQVGIIESMRVPHEVHAGVAGEVVDVLVRDGQPVEYGQPLFVLRTASTKHS